MKSDDNGAKAGAWSLSLQTGLAIRDWSLTADPSTLGVGVGAWVQVQGESGSRVGPMY